MRRKQTVSLSGPALHKPSVRFRPTYAFRANQIVCRGPFLGRAHLEFLDREARLLEPPGEARVAPPMQQGLAQNWRRASDCAWTSTICCAAISALPSFRP